MATPSSVFPSRLVQPGDELVGPLTAVSTELKLGDGLVASSAGDSIRASKAGILSLRGANRFSIQTASRRYVPAVGDVVVGIVSDRNAEFYKVQLHATAVATLPVLAFDGATKRNKPNLAIGSAIFARVASCSKHMDPELSCQGRGAPSSLQSVLLIFTMLASLFM